MGFIQNLLFLEVLKKGINGYTVFDIKAIEWRHSEAYENSSFIFTAVFQSVYFRFTLQQGTKYTWCILHVSHSQMEKTGNKNETM